MRDRLGAAAARLAQAEPRGSPKLIRDTLWRDPWSFVGGRIRDQRFSEHAAKVLCKQRFFSNSGFFSGSNAMSKALQLVFERHCRMLDRRHMDRPRFWRADAMMHERNRHLLQMFLSSYDILLGCCERSKCCTLWAPGLLKAGLMG
jgi:hypothetical protein